MIIELDTLAFDMYETRTGETIATCEMFPTLCGIGDDDDEAADDLSAEIIDYLGRQTWH